MLRYRNADLQTILRQVARWYDIDVEYTGNITDQRITGGVPSTAPLSTLLKTLDRLGVKFELQSNSKGKKLIVTGN